MGIDFKFNINTKIKVNGKEYGSVEEVPEQYRETVKNAVAPAGTPFGHKKITVNGVGYDSPEAMPPEARRIYEAALAKAGSAGGDPLLPSAGDGAGPEGPVKEGGLSGRTLAILLLLAAAAYLAIRFTPR